MDERALKILFNAFWSSRGWKDGTERGASPTDFAYAKSKGVMFDPVKYNHRDVLKELSASIQRLDRRRVADGFLASLSTRRLDWRSAFGSYGVFQHMATHSRIGTGVRCEVCGFYLDEKGEDLNVLNFERFKWGGVRHSHPTYALFDLKLFLESQPTQPMEADLKIFREIIAAIRRAPANVSSADLSSHFARIIKSNKAERDVIIAMLGFWGILATRGHQTFADHFVPACERTLPNRRFVDMPYPACWWHGVDGLNESRLNECFGHVF